MPDADRESFQKRGSSRPGARAKRGSRREPALPLDLGTEAGEGAVGDPVQVVVDVRTPDLPQPLTYLAPPHLQGELRFGSTVLVPLRGREQIGYVVGLTDCGLRIADCGFGKELDVSSEDVPPSSNPQSAIRNPQWKLRPIAALLRPESAFEPSLYALVEWIAARTHTSLEEALHCIAPEGQMLSVSATIRLAPAWREHAEATARGWGKAIRAVAARIRQVLVEAGGALELEALRRQVPEDLLPAVLRRLRDLNWIEEVRTVTPPRLHEKRVKAVRPARDEGMKGAGDDGIISPSPLPVSPHPPRLGPKQQVVLDHLRGLPESALPVPQQQLCRELGISEECVRSLVARGLLVAETVAVSRVPDRGEGLSVGPSLIETQSTAVEAIVASMGRATRRPFLLFGVTGSGKTEVYLRACEAAIDAGRRAIYLVPEISLTAQVIEQFRARFGRRVGLLHSRLSDGERFDEWQRIRRGDVAVVLGPRSALFAPVRDLGLLVVDEEHDTSYKQDSAPRYLTRDVAEQRAALEGATLVLGSATPAVETFHRVEQGGIERLDLPERIFSRPLPEVDVIDLRAESRARPGLIFGARLEEAIRESLSRREQVILFLNRRGFSTFLLCRDCGYVARCPNCNVSLTLHQELGNRLLCHHCGYGRRAPATCPRCAGERIRHFGIGTERVEAAACDAFPEARVVRLDRDTTTRKDSHHQIVKRFRERDADILIGTQMVAKGFDFPNVTLVGVITADTALNLPDFRAAERSFQLLSQVSGRSGRGERLGRVIVQTFSPDHYSIQAAAAHDYLGFYRQEINYRRELAYPPFTTLARLIVADASDEASRGKIHVAHQLLFEAAEEAGVQILGPCAAPLARVNRKYRWHMLMKCVDREALQSLLRDHLSELRHQVGAGLIIDVDPQSLL
jgi:primosomal protein N' (replication factor Y)